MISLKWPTVNILQSLSSKYFFRIFLFSPLCKKDPFCIYRCVKPSAFCQAIPLRNDLQCLVLCPVLWHGFLANPSLLNDVPPLLTSPCFLYMRKKWKKAVCVRNNSLPARNMCRYCVWKASALSRLHLSYFDLQHLLQLLSVLAGNTHHCQVLHLLGKIRCQQHWLDILSYKVMQTLVW